MEKIGIKTKDDDYIFASSKTESDFVGLAASKLRHGNFIIEKIQGGLKFMFFIFNCFRLQIVPARLDGAIESDDRSRIVLPAEELLDFSLQN